MTALVYLYQNPDFASFNLVLAAALPGNFSAFDYNVLYASEYSAGILSVLPLLCLDTCEEIHYNSSLSSGFTDLVCSDFGQPNVF